MEQLQALAPVSGSLVSVTEVVGESLQITIKLGSAKIIFLKNF